MNTHLKSVNVDRQPAVKSIENKMLPHNIAALNFGYRAFVSKLFENGITRRADVDKIYLQN